MLFKKSRYALVLLAFILLLCFALFRINLLLVLGFSLLAVGVRLFNKLKGFSFSLWIFAAVSLAMLYPQYFISAGNFEFKLLIVPLLQIIMFGMGSQMSIKDFTGVIQMPKGVIAGVICQFTIMPVMGITVATLFNFPSEIAAGIILVGSSPSGMASNVMSFIAKANLALSVTLTAFATLLSPIMTPLLMKLFAREFIEIDFGNMMIGIFNMVILPICAGFIFNLFVNKIRGLNSLILQLAIYTTIIGGKNVLGLINGDLAANGLVSPFVKDMLLFAVSPIVLALLFKTYAKGNRQMLEKVLSFISMLGIAVIITVITAAGRDSLVEVGLLLIVACLVQNLFGYTLGYGVAKLLRLNEKDCKTIALEVGMQNGGLASGLAMQMGKVATVGLAPAVFGPLMNITGSSLATWWRGRFSKA